LGDGQLLSFIDRNVQENKIFDDPSQYWNSDQALFLNKNYNIERQQRDFLNNDESGFDVKLAVTVKKLDNSIHSFIHLT